MYCALYEVMVVVGDITNEREMLQEAETQINQRRWRNDTLAHARRDGNARVDQR